MALLNLNRYFESFQNVVGKITKTFSWLKRKFSDNIVDAIFLIIFAVIAIIIGIVLAIPYAFLLGEENILKWGFTHSFDISVLTAVSVFGCVVSFGVVRVMGGWFRMVLAIFFWALTLFGPIIWTHLVKLLGESEMIQYRKLTIFLPVVFLIVSISVYAFIDDARDKKRNRKLKKLEKELGNV
ncbi:MAG: hypothetical protein AAB334_00955 [Patescibacteria group bacterium]